MIDFRYHVVSIVAVFLALALGLFIGSTTLRGTVANDLTERTAQVTHDYTAATQRIGNLEGQLSDWDAFNRSLEPYVFGSRLAGRTVTVVSAPDVDNDVRSAVQDAVAAAGATVNGDVRLQKTLFDAGQDQFLTTLTDRLALSNRDLPAGTGQERALALADVLGTKPQGRPLGPVASQRVLSAFSDGKLIAVSGDAPRPASLLVLLAPTPPLPTDTDADQQAAADMVSLLTSFAGDLDQTSTGAVVAGESLAASDGGLLDAIRSDKELRAQVSTVDGAEWANGVIATVLALVEQGEGGSGSYGLAAGGDAHVPQQHTP